MIYLASYQLNYTGAQVDEAIGKMLSMSSSGSEILDRPIPEKNDSAGVLKLIDRNAVNISPKIIVLTR